MQERTSAYERVLTRTRAYVHVYKSAMSACKLAGSEATEREISSVNFTRGCVKAIPSGSLVSGQGLSLVNRRAGGFIHYPCTGVSLPRSAAVDTS